MTSAQTPATTAVASATPVAALRDVVVRFGAVTVLHGVDIELQAGQVHALVGANGAGKSTLVKALTGVNVVASGTVEIDGEPVTFGGPQDARAKGLEIVYQDQPLAAHLSVSDNIFLGRERTSLGLLDRARMRRTATEVLEQIDADCSPDDLVDDLTPTQRVQVSIAAALAAEPRLLVLDEPTAALGSVEAETVYGLVRAATDRGVAVLYISHRLGEITSLAHRITVLRDGRVARSAPVAELSTDEMITAMVGRELTALFPDRDNTPGQDLLAVSGLRSEPLVQSMDFTVRSGEIVGLAGLVGSGASETVSALFGDRRSTGTVTLDGKDARASSPRRAVAAGLAMVPEERRTEALFPGMTVGQNITSAVLGSTSTAGVLRPATERTIAERLVDELGVVTAGIKQDVATLSGGNQQKVVVGRWLARGGRVYLVDEPTAGVDVGAKIEIYRQLGKLAADGAAVVVVSSDFEELIGLCDRILVVRDGRITDSVRPADTDVERLTALAADSRAETEQPTTRAETEQPTTRASDGASAPNAAARAATTVPTATAATAAVQARKDRRQLLRRIGVPAAMVLVLVALAIGAPSLVGGASLLEILRQASTPALLAAALAIALGSGAFDLSVGATAQLTANASAALIVSGVPTIVAVVAGIAIGAVIGAINGAVTTVLRVPSFVATLGMLFLLVGITLGVNGGLTAGIDRTSGFILLGQGWIGPIPVIVLWAVLVVAAVFVLWRFTAIGLRLRAVGDDAALAALRGVKVRRSSLQALTVSGAVSGLAGVLMASYSGGSTANDVSLTLLVSALAAAFLGSAMTRGFLFDPATAACGALFVTAVGVGLISNGLSDQLLAGVQGLALLLAVLVAVARRRRLGQVAIF